MFPLIHYLESADEVSSLDILSNGTLINESMVEQIRELEKIRCVQISLDGSSPESNDAIHGKGTFEKVVRSLHLLRNKGISVNIMFTLQRKNVRDISSITDLAVAEGINSLTIERFVPTGSGAKISNQLLSPEEIKRVFNYISERAEQEIKAAPITQRIFRECLAGKGLKAIARSLNADGISSSTGKKWGGSFN